ncbi:XdhC family protein [Paenibacillus wenxiniae]|uniref:XdhC family protein n=1 Tax=Paenibacillus wenxiniae TaxID=1636843 RepID=A0ABW4RQI0_9BACL
MDMKDLCEAALREDEYHIRTVLATVVHVEGHAYRKEGVSMILTEDGRHYGTISPGCLEDDLCARVEQAWSSERVCIVEYDMRPKDDLSWGENIGCGGLLHILLEPIRGELLALMSNIYTQLGHGEVVRLTRCFRNEGERVQYSLVSGHHMMADSAASVLATDHTDSMDSLHTLMLAHHDTARLPAGETQPDLAEPYVFIRTYRPKPRLIVIGAGDDSRMVNTLARAAGFDVVIGDWRTALCTTERFPGAQCVTGFPEELYEQIHPGQGDYVLLMSHNFPREREWIERLQDCPYTYLGIMGSSERTRRLLDGLPNYPNLHSPVGLSIGADGPDEIAISIAAELIAVKRGKQQQSQEVTRYGHRRTGTCRW